MRNLIFILYGLVAFGLAAKSGSLDSGFAAFMDEPSHLVTGLMVHDFLSSMNFSNPLGYAENYYLHYPKVGIGQWPPLFYLIQGLWSLLFGIDRVTLLLLMSVLSAAIALAIYKSLRTACGELLGALGGLIFLLLPEVQKVTGSVMTEIPLTLFCFIAILQFGRFVDDRKNYHILLFTLFSVLALMTKGNAIAIALVPPLVVVITKKWDLLSEKAIWISAIIVGMLCAPWYIVTLDMIQGTWTGNGLSRLAYLSKALQFYAKNLVGLGGVIMTSLVILGFITKTRCSEKSGVWISVAAWFISLLVFHLLVPSSIESRHLVLLAPVWVVGFILGCHWLYLKVLALKIRGALVIPLLAIVFFAVEAFYIPSKSFQGYEQVSADLLADHELAHSVFLIAADARGEGLFISELALLESLRPNHIVQRSSKVLSQSNWLGGNYRSLFDSPEQLNDYLIHVPVGIVVIDLSSEDIIEYPHYNLLLEAIQENPANWKKKGSYDVTRKGIHFPDSLLVFQLVENLTISKKDQEVQQVEHQKIPKKVRKVQQAIQNRLQNFSKRKFF